MRAIHLFCKLIKANAEVTKCRNCKSVDLLMLVRRIDKDIYKKYSCNKCGRVFYSQEKVLKRKPLKW